MVKRGMAWVIKGDEAYRAAFRPLNPFSEIRGDAVLDQVGDTDELRVHMV